MRTMSGINRIFNGYIFDLDGTIWLTDQLIEDAQETVISLRERGSRVIFLTNNSDGTREMFAQILSEKGIPTTTEEVISTSYVMAHYLRKQSPHCRCYVIGPDPLREELCRQGMILSDRPDEVEYVVLGIDRDFTYRKLQTAFEAIRAGARFVATNPDPYVPMAHGYMADIGALIAAIEVSTQHPLDVLIGKPNSPIVNMALDALDLPKRECLMVGDQLQTDVLAAKRVGLQVALLLRDPNVRAKLPASDTKPDFVIENLKDLII